MLVSWLMGYSAKVSCGLRPIKFLSRSNTNCNVTLLGDKECLKPSVKAFGRLHWKEWDFVSTGRCGISFALEGVGSSTPEDSSFLGFFSES